MSEDACLSSAPNLMLDAVVRDQDEGHGASGEKGPGCFNATDRWEVQIEQQEVRLQALGGRQHRRLIPDDAKHVMTQAFQLRRETRRDELHLLGNQNPQLPHETPRRSRR